MSFIAQESSTAILFVWNLPVFGSNAAAIIAKQPNAMLVYQT